MNPIWPFSWCRWTEWSDCAIEPCFPGPRSLRSQNYQSSLPHPPKDIAVKEFCVNSTWLPITAYRWPESEESFSSEIIIPMQMRRRQCRCHTVTNLLGRIFGRSCSEFEEQVECHTCFHPSSRVYTHFSDGEALLSCTELADNRSAEAAAVAAANSSRFYAILGGTLGIAAFLILVFCCIRFFLLSSAARRRVARRSADDVVTNNADNASHDPTLRRSGVGLPYPHFLNPELPPAYKDVVAMTAILPTDSDTRSLHGDNNATTQLLLSPMPPFPHSVQVAIPVSPPPLPSSASQPEGNAVEDAEEPPPPSYQEVIAFSPSAADMRQRVMAASIAAESQENQKQSTSAVS